MPTNANAERLRTLAIEQGWTVELTKDQHWCFKAPDGHTSVITSGPRGAWSNSGIANATSQLRRAGLIIPHAGPKKAAPKECPMPRLEILQPVDPEPPAPAGLTPIELAETVDAAVQMIEELADSFLTFRKGVQEAIAELRGDQRTASRAIEALQKKVADGVTVAEAADEMKRQLLPLKEKITALETAVAKADPIGNFRAKLGRG